MAKEEFKEELYRQIDANIAEISDPNYEYMNPMTKSDWTAIWIIMAIMIVGVFIGNYLM